MTSATSGAIAEEWSFAVDLVTLLRGRAAEVDRPACTFVSYQTERDGTALTLTYADLDRRARAVAAAIQDRCAPGDRAVILCPQGLEYIVAFTACLYAGVIGVPLYAPDLHRSNERLSVVTADADPKVLLTTADSRAGVLGVLEDEPRIDVKEVLCVDEIEDAEAGRWRAPAIVSSEVAYLQYTSGSTRRPAGVEVTHDNMAVGAFQCADRLGVAADDVVVSWLPFFHDMGLVLTLITPLFAGARTVFTAPFSFIQRPVRWLRLITEHRGTVTATPNFGLDMCVARVTPEHKETLDLSSLHTLANGAEPVRWPSLQRFSEEFQACGFRAEAHSPGYGLAEATLAVTTTPIGAGARVTEFDAEALTRGIVRPAGGADTRPRRLVGCGTPAHQDVRIVDPETAAPAAADRVGEVWVRGGNVCRGYRDQPERTSEVFGAALAGEPDGAWLRTGDLGFVVGDELYIAGRVKDLVIVAGRNHYPEDIELTVEGTHPAIRTGHVIAFAVEEDDAEKLVVVAELENRHQPAPDPDELRRDIRNAISSAHDIELHDLALVRRGSIPKTSSGKVQRRACRERYLSGELQPAL